MLRQQSKDGQATATRLAVIEARLEERSRQPARRQHWLLRLIGWPAPQTHPPVKPARKPQKAGGSDVGAKTQGKSSTSS
jgi:hypothetical protein